MSGILVFVHNLEMVSWKWTLVGGVIVPYFPYTCVLFNPLVTILSEAGLVPAPGTFILTQPSSLVTVSVLPPFESVSVITSPDKHSPCSSATSSTQRIWRTSSSRSATPHRTVERYSLTL